MDTPELIIWAAMLGGLLTLAALAIADALLNRTLGSVRNIVFVCVAGAACVVMSGLLDELLPELPDRFLMVLKASLGPLGGALALHYLGNWLGGARDDAVVHRLSSWGAAVVFAAAGVLAVLGALVDETDFRRLLWASAAANMTPVLLALAAVLRAMLLGDLLARWMLLACVLLATTVVGLYLRGLGIPGFGLGTWLLTAWATLTFFLMATVLVFLRNRHNRLLARLAGQNNGADVATGLPTGSVLLTQVDDAFARSARLHGEITVVCLVLGNLYELAETAGRGVEQQILTATAARIRRAAGFRCVVGLYHPRCFIVVFHADKGREQVGRLVTRLRSMASQPLTVLDAKHLHHGFVPRVGMGVATVHPAQARPMDVLNEAERQALSKMRSPHGNGHSEDEIETAWDTLPDTPQSH